MTLFNYLDLETVSSCNRVCPTCIRNSHPDREAVATFFERNLLPEEVIYEALDQAVAMGFAGGVCLSHYNEPLMDERLPAIARRVRAYGRFSRIFLNTNGDFLTPELAAELDEALDRIIVTLYMDEPMKSERAVWLTSLFHRLELHIITMSTHIPTHFSPKYPVALMAEQRRGFGCNEPYMRVIINHRRQWLLCCEDVVGNFDLGTFPEIGVADHWNKVLEIAGPLSAAGGRIRHAYCRSCPR